MTKPDTDSNPRIIVGNTYESTFPAPNAGNRSGRPKNLFPKKPKK